MTTDTGKEPAADQIGVHLEIALEHLQDAWKLARRADRTPRAEEIGEAERVVRRLVEVEDEDVSTGEPSRYGGYSTSLSAGNPVRVAQFGRGATLRT